VAAELTFRALLRRVRSFALAEDASSTGSRSSSEECGRCRWGWP